MFVLALIILLVLAMVYLLVGLLIAKFALLWLASLFPTAQNGSREARTPI